jgi:hypothetical protein
MSIAIRLVLVLPMLLLADDVLRGAQKMIVLKMHVHKTCSTCTCQEHFDCMVQIHAEGRAGASDYVDSLAGSGCSGCTWLTACSMLGQLTMLVSVALLT